jgi:hypothetical protein
MQYALIFYDFQLILARMGLPGVVTEPCFLVATALRYTLHSPEAPCLRRLLSADLPWPWQTD